MTNQFETSKDEESAAKGKLERRLVFVSHSHADRELASALKTLIDDVFSGVVEAFVSSDPGPTGGMLPGEEWYSQIQANLGRAEAVWVLATPTSIKRPWIYWEAGTGRALCPRGVVVLRVKLAIGEVPSPLNNFQSYDGLKTAEVVELVGKVATQIGLKLAPILTQTCAKDWVGMADKYEPLLPEAGEELPTLTPERLDRLDGAIARLEAISVPSASERVSARELDDEELERAEQRARRLTQERVARRRERAVGSRAIIYDSLDEFVRVIESAPTETVFEAQPIDIDGDAPVQATSRGQNVYIYLRSTELAFVDDRPELSERTRGLLKEIVRLRDEASEDASS